MDRYRALLIGNWAYDDPGGELQPLLGPETDLAKMTEALTDPVVGLFGEADVVAVPNLGLMAMGRAISDFINSSRSDDRLLVYFSGHGVRRESDDLLGLCGVDADTRNTPGSTYRAADLTALLRRAPSAASVLVLDCCYAGNIEDKGPDTDLLSRSLDVSDAFGLYVLASSRSRPSKAATTPDTPSRFTGELIKTLLDTDLEGDANGYLSADTVWGRLETLQPRPYRSISAQGVFPLARRTVTATRAEHDLPQYRELEADHVVLTFHAGGDGTVEVGGDRTGDGRFELDPARIAAIRRLERLAEAVGRLPRRGTQDYDWQRLSHKAWEAIGTNLAAGLRDDLGHRLRPEPDHHGRDRFLQVSLRFEDEGDAAEGLPWERLCLDAAAPESSMATGRGVVVERVVGTGRTSWSSATGEERLTVGVLNTLPPDLELLGKRAAAELEASRGTLLVFRLHGQEANWRAFVDSLSRHQPRSLAIFAPFRNASDPEIGFPGQRGEPDWRPVTEVINWVKDLQLDLDVVTLTTYALPPSWEARRSLAKACHDIVAAGVAPVAGLVHGGAYHDYLESHDDPVFTAMLLKAVAAGQPLARSVLWARDQVLLLANQEGKASFGVPSLYVPDTLEEPTGTPMATSTVGRSQRGRGAPPSKVAP